MKYYYNLYLKAIMMSVILLRSQTATAQDKIYLKGGEILNARLLEVSSGHIRYMLQDNPTGPVHVLSRTEIDSVVYANNTKELIRSYYLKGFADARKNYKQGGKVFGITLVSSVFSSPILGLAPAIAFTRVTPKDKNLNYPDSALMQNYDYRLGYLARVKKIKKVNAWSAWGTTWGLYALAGLLPAFLIHWRG